VTVSAVATTLFLGGWRAPWPISTFWEGANHGWWPMLWFVIKVVAIIFVFVWLRGTLPRLRYDQFMALGWKILIPASLVWILIVASFKQLTNLGYTRFQVLAYVGIPLALIVLVASFFLENKTVAAAQTEPPPDEPSAGGADRNSYPMPVLVGAPPASSAPGPATPVVHDIEEVPGG